MFVLILDVFKTLTTLFALKFGFPIITDFNALQEFKLHRLIQ